MRPREIRHRPRWQTCQWEPKPIGKGRFRRPRPVRDHFPRDAQQAPVAQLDRAPDYESGGREFESLRARHFGTKLGTPKPAVFAIEAATRVRRSTLLDPMMRTSFLSTFFAKLRSDKNQAKRSGSSFRADSLQPLCRLFGGPHVRHVRQMDRSQDAGAASAVPVVC
jgi:hypothetical protein